MFLIARKDQESGKFVLWENGKGKPMELDEKGAKQALLMSFNEGVPTILLRRVSIGFTIENED